MQVGGMQVGAMQEHLGGWGVGLNCIQNQVVSFWSFYFGRKGRSGLKFVQLDKISKICIPFLLSSEGWQKFRLKLITMPNRELKFEFAVVHAQNTLKKIHILYTPSVNVETITQKHR